MAKPKIPPKSLDPDLLGPCMLYCGHCGVYQKGKCEGCGPMARNLEKQGKDICGMRACVVKNGITMCAECNEYPCARFDEIFSRGFTENLRTSNH